MRAKMSDGDVREQVRTTARSVVPATTGLVIRADVFRGLMPFPTKEFRADADAYLSFGACLAAPVRVVPAPLGEYRMHAAGHYLWRVTTAEGLRAWLAMQRLIAAHFGVEPALRHNSYFTRHVFALRKLEGAPAWSAYRDLLRSTVRDPFFSWRQKLLFGGLWTTCALAPTSAFNRLWHRFQLRHTGHGKIAALAGSNGAPAAAPASRAS
jgi:hypothetical protein